MNTLNRVNMKNRIAALFLLFLFLLSASVFPTVTANAEKRIDFHGIDITDYDSIDVYRMKIPLNKIGKLNLPYGDSAVVGGLVKMFKRVEATMIVTFIFPEITVTDENTGEESTVFITGHTRCVLPSAISFNIFNPSSVVEFAEDELILSLTNNYYKYFESVNADFSKVQISIGQNGKSAPVYTGNWCTENVFEVSGIEIYSVGVPPAVFDPESPDFDIDEGNTGSNLEPEPKPEEASSKGCGFDWDNFLKLPNWVLYTLFGLGVLFVVLVMFKLFT